MPKYPWISRYQTRGIYCLVMINESTSGVSDTMQFPHIHHNLTFTFLSSRIQIKMYIQLIKLIKRQMRLFIYKLSIVKCLNTKRNTSSRNVLYKSWHANDAFTLTWGAYIYRLKDGQVMHGCVLRIASRTETEAGLYHW